ncbi:hypothetical protein E4T56_gene12817 [Termitomyces sp. T112]|nr:hypothetical protein E4T56_gene12817 [Termitomyces sp. T112]
MSSPSYSATTPTPLISDADVVIVYDSEGEEFERWCQAGVIYWSREQHQLVSSGWLTEFCRGVRGGGGGGGCRRGPTIAANPSGRGDSGEVCKGIGVGLGPPNAGMVPKRGPSPIETFKRYIPHIGMMRALGTGVKFSGAPTFDHRGLFLQAGGGSNGGVDGMGGGALLGKGGLKCSAGGEGGIGAGTEHLGASGNGASTRGMGLVGASDAVGGAAHGGGRGAGNGTGG